MKAKEKKIIKGYKKLCKINIRIFFFNFIVFFIFFIINFKFVMVVNIICCFIHLQILKNLHKELNNYKLQIE